jgi:hypothetical protein
MYLQYNNNMLTEIKENKKRNLLKLLKWGKEDE